MGLLKVGTPLHWKDSLEHCNYVREHGILQFIATYRRLKHLENDRLFYGDEIEYSMLKVDEANRTVKISLRGPEAMEALRKSEQVIHAFRGCTWHQEWEYGSWMLEGTPDLPYGGYTMSLTSVEQNMRLRRGRLLSALARDEIAPTLVTFPLMGVGEFTSPSAPPGGEASQSDFVPDVCINPHPRFGTLTGNIRRRRGSKVDIRVPLYQDVKTPEFQTTKDPQIHMDCMAFGMGCCCLQVTFQASDIDESRLLYDQLANLAPIMMALTAATPVVKGRLASTDVRWSLISQSVDDRTPAERGEGTSEANPQMAGSGVKRQSKSRYDSISCYIHPASEIYSDIPCEIDDDLLALLKKEGIDETMSCHMAHLFTRDPLVIFEGHVEVDDLATTEHFESIQSTNWQTVRWKPPPTKAPGANACAPHVGWRTEFRSMEVQLTDFENAAFTAFIVIVTRAILVFNLTLLSPLSKVDENMRRAHGMDAVRKSKFWFRKHILPDDTDDFMLQKCPEQQPLNAEAKSSQFEEMTMDEIMNGKSCYFPGLVPLCYAYLEHIGCDETSFRRIDEYLKLIKARATGHQVTPATWMRSFVHGHKDYKQDSVVSESIAYDLVHACNDIGLGKRACPELLGDVKIEPITAHGQYETPLYGERLGPEERRGLLDKIMLRASECDGTFSPPSSAGMRRQTSGHLVDREFLGCLESWGGQG
ncbi:Glutamate--cysteine ligase catalytic subunit (GCS heavy chain) (Gamma-ECS) (Gamma-glutamylcysteine synthetase) [Durusdinium trenchii]|uniref:Glutamate--cysteine ligase n=1 Tax=Durusdinium trenchii TaxID=1381693 RepID=A0ABP0S316_9DINO